MVMMIDRASRFSWLLCLLQRGAIKVLRLPGDLGVRVSPVARHNLPRPQTGKHPYRPVGKPQS